jgi:hypothetical protein
MIKMMELLPETTQNQVVEHVREYVADLQDEQRWDALFQKSQIKLMAAARRAKEEKAKGLAKPMDYNQL